MCMLIQLTEIKLFPKYMNTHLFIADANNRSLYWRKKERERAVTENTNWIILWSLWIWYVRKQPLNNEVYIYTNNNIRKLFVTDIYVLLHIFYNQRMNSEKKTRQSINQSILIVQDPINAKVYIFSKTGCKV